MIDVELSDASLRDWLRSKTRTAHDRADATFGALLQEGAQGYATLLAAHALSAPALCFRIRMQPTLPFAPDFSPALVTALLNRDLQALGLKTPTPHPPDGFLTAAECAGAAYTLAGSRLGAKVIARQWRDEWPDNRFSSAYLNHDNLFGDWRTFCGRLNALADGALDRDLILKGALEAFALFETACTAATPLASDV
ncbi:biliverdin-producing heme oxygenase [Hyphococcus sp.]|uniref:biliverdin-producing heme oxygenase n=1 Tax=Hyphococcus sp. TaxID=2038636 RepID=UPI0035C66633